MELGDRKQKILGAVVRDYVETVRPVGSEELASRYAAWGVKSATIRNELAELAEMGLLRQPHTSAGRIPSDQGYRFYVDNLMERENPERFAKASEIDATLELESLLRHTCAILTRITSYTSVATPPRPADTLLSQLFLTPVGGNRLLVAMLLSTGQVENRLLSASMEQPATDIPALGNALNAWLAGKSLETIKSPAFDSVDASTPTEFSPILRGVYVAIAQAVRHVVREMADEDHVLLEGATEIFKQPEFRDTEKTETVLGILQRGALMFQSESFPEAVMVSSLRSASRPDFRSRTKVTVVIGAENRVVGMHECSVVTAPYYVGTRLRGTIGVVGPTRMNYDRAVPAVNFFASTLSTTLTHLNA